MDGSFNRLILLFYDGINQYSKQDLSVRFKSTFKVYSLLSIDCMVRTVSCMTKMTMNVKCTYDFAQCITVNDHL